MYRLIGLLLILTACGNSEESLQKFASNEDYQKETGREVTLIYSDSAVIKTRITAPLMIRTPGDNPYTEMPEGIRALFFDGEGNQNSVLTANRAIQYPKSGLMEAHGNVVVVNELGDTLYTEKLVWLESEERIYSDEFVRIVRPDEIIFGDGLESNQNFTRYKILNIRGTISLLDEE
ncbi:MAG: LPS export ABC transporter periplasmic protein LptC [Bacteroidia bacterium]|jgi:LPS export ABC transporter protein LptC